MSAAPPPNSPAGLTVAALARTWAAAVSRTTYLPMSGEEVEQLLAGLIDRLLAAVAAPRFDERIAIEVAAKLVAHHVTGPRSMGCCIEILGSGLPRLAALRHTDGLGVAVLKVLGALADGYAEALRQHTFDEQEQVNQALLKAKRDAERGLRVSEARFREVFSASAVGIAISGLDGALIEANKTFADFVGRPVPDLAGAGLLELLHAQHDAVLREEYRKLTDGELPRFRRRRKLTDASGGDAWIYLVGSLLRDADGVPTHHITIVEDFTELQLLQRELSNQSLYDKLTKLPNEHYFMSRLQEVLESADPAALVTVYRVNLDNFSMISDGLGRTSGEQLLCTVATRLVDLVSAERALVARMGADDFAILIEDTAATPDPRVLAAGINVALSEPVYLGKRGVAVSAGVGVVRRKAGGISPGELIRAADTTLHRVKRSGRGQWGLYDADADAREGNRYRLAAEMPGAHENGEITLGYEPVHCLRSGHVLAQRALLCWDRAGGTVLSHSDCLVLAEQTGLVLTIGRWMLQQACAELSTGSPAPGTEPLLLRVDLTARLSQDPDLISVVHEALSGTGVPAARLQIGVPLMALARDRGDVVDNVQVLAELGAGIVLRGAAAGSGYLAYLEDLPVTGVEIAPPTVRRLAERPGDDSLVAQAIRQLVPLVHSVGVTVTVPAVDTAAQADWWRCAGADAALGSHFGPPAPPGQSAVG